MAKPYGFSAFRNFVIRPRVLVAAVAACLAATVGYFIFRQTGDPQPLAAYGQSQLTRRLAALGTYAARGELGSLVPQADAILAIREQFLQRVIDQSLPFRQYFEDGRYVARLDSADVRLDSGLALVTLSGRGMLAGQEESPLYADLFLQGLMNITGVDPDSGTLQASLVITEVRALRARPQDLQTLLNPVARYFGRLKAEDWNRNRQRVHLPLRIDREIVLPQMDGDVSIPESRIPVSVSVSAVTTLDGRMAVSLALLPDAESGEKDVRQEGRWNPESRPGRLPAPWIRLLPQRDRHRAEEQSLRVQVARLASGDSLWRAVVSTDHDVVAIVPPPVLTRVVTRVSHRYLGGVDVDIRPEATVQLDEVLRVKILGSKMGVGRIKGSVLISHLKGRLTVAGDPHVTLDPPHDLVVTAPVRVVSGRGTVTMNMEWDPAYLVNSVCPGFQFHETLSGEILPFRDDLTTRIQYAILDSNIVGRPRVQRDVVRLPADLTDSSWDKIQEILVAQDRLSRCGMVMNADSVLMKLRKLARRGVKIRLPAKMFKPFQLPVVLEKQYSAGNYRIEARAFDPAIGVTSQYLRLAFRVNLRVIPAPGAGGNVSQLEPLPRRD